MKLGKIGRPSETHASHLQADEAAQVRVAAARTCRAWQETDGDRLVTREGGYLVDPDSDEVFVAYRGDAFSPSGMVVADMTPLRFYVDGDDVVVLELQPDSWSAMTYQAARR